MVASPKRQDLQSMLAEVKAALVALGNKTFFSVVVGLGGITINGGRIKITSSGGIQLPAGGTITDALGNIIFSADSTNGARLSTPFIPVVLYAEFGNRTVGRGFMTALASDIGTSETQIWEGTIAQVTHSGIHWRFSGGDLSAGTNTTTYRLYVNGVVVDSFSAATSTVHDQAKFAEYIAATPVYGVSGAGIIITAQCTTSNANQIACQLISCDQRGQ